MLKRKLLFFICSFTMITLIGNGIKIAFDFIHHNKYLLYNQNIVDSKNSFYNHAINILLIGLDNGGYRSDIIMLVHYQPETGNIKFLSIPRDTMVKYKGNVSKINAIYAIGKEELIKNTIENLTGLDIKYYLTANFSGFRRIVDILNGVYLNVPINMDYEDPEQGLAIHLKKGPQLLNGKKAEQFVRYRKSDTNNGNEIGDMGRINMQLYFIKELINQKLEFKYIVKADEIFKELKRQVKTNINSTDINNILPYINNVSSDKIQTFIAPGKSKLIDDIWYYIVDSDKTVLIVRQNFAII